MFTQQDNNYLAKKLSEQHLQSRHKGKQNHCLLKSLPRFYPLTCPSIYVFSCLGNGGNTKAELQHFYSNLCRELCLELLPWKLNKKNKILECSQSTLKRGWPVLAYRSSWNCRTYCEFSFWWNPRWFSKKRQCLCRIYRVFECFSWRGTISIALRALYSFSYSKLENNLLHNQKIVPCLCLVMRIVCQHVYNKVAGWIMDKIYRVS